ncbi:hypothetical protein BL250_15995 [Erwinia sp. OLTSP20]|uniref:glycine zipper domain-containing protein n=1 Tax=unclassified Erwinia TaxID=2622719 RepID=UPI000C17CB0D|nr:MULTISPECIES: hypothetical protein [unclassified Erwinia]PIJ49219.1 hypothetical protein BV501_13490 [Erwinia sp. OAMSP11]PIJ70501.1 hypothetical protein BK416_13130 [Erwinia sp. OLSSP12]PIJ78749.1 hypothetical protein BLD47_16970 [Erwinia sp. OLCASP19]PIJ81228.1 hypothetical protein BLD46_12895 [Erwinia sp. OLMTSP26]PIJ84477.1 hypothetical protein BLD49_12100 [Erwinia sp. OLMDSP33]
MVSRRQVKNAQEESEEAVTKSSCAAMDELCNLTQVSCRYIKENPWAGVGLGATLGLVVGALLSRK